VSITELPTIPQSDYVRRWNAVQRLMAEKGIDLIVTQSNDRATAGAAHADISPVFHPTSRPYASFYHGKGSLCSSVGLKVRNTPESSGG
jgi:hypothetical protein